MSIQRNEGGAIALAERIFAVLDQGRFTATYKHAVLLATMDLCLEKTTSQGLAPDSLTTRELAEKVLELYWPQVLPYSRGSEAEVLLQNIGRRQAEIVASVARFRSAFPADPLLPIDRARRTDPAGYRRLLDHVEWKLIEMPLPRLQTVGNVQSRFLYDTAWDQAVTAAQVRAYQRGKEADFDNRILLKSRVGEYLVQLNGLLRPLLYRPMGRASRQDEPVGSLSAGGVPICFPARFDGARPGIARRAADRGASIARAVSSGTQRWTISSRGVGIRTTTSPTSWRPIRRVTARSGTFSPRRTTLSDGGHGSKTGNIPISLPSRPAPPGRGGPRRVSASAAGSISGCRERPHCGSPTTDSSRRTSRGYVGP